ncbi:imidazole glycerol phosphate synthase subunit HisH [Candidatus Pelagibacter sp.]|jgi:imidazole glycerol-phosphate synthase subunit HisH|nr:imidazole glycerol phosphate synthase subunit HisH [Candidatus Pelagibacter sp.]
MIGIIDYGIGNINAFYNIYKEKNINLKIISNSEDLNQNIKKLILPGVGSFDNAVSLLQEKKLFKKIIDFTKNPDNKILGICIGMQILAQRSLEGNLNGMNLIDGKFEKLKNKILPHIGWNNIKFNNKINIFEGIDQNSYFYFLHSYALLSLNEQYKICETFYGENFVSAFKKDNIYGIQFHPEKSHLLGSKILLNFYEYA